MQLCQNRPEGFGPHSSIHPNLPTTCFLDVIVEPLATWLFLVLMLLLLPLRIRHHRSVPPSFAFKPDEAKVDTDGKPAHARRPCLFARVLSAIYYILILAELAMASLEIARLSVAQLGIGLLPFTYVGVLVALANRLSWRSRAARLANAFYWLVLATTVGLKVAAVQYEQMDPATRRTAAGSGVQGQYPTSDQVVDNAVIVGVVVVLACLEFVGFGKLAAT